jgi:diguanylate cyclase (GGDEF)-like protein
MFQGMALQILLVAAVVGAGVRIAVLHRRMRALEQQVIRDPLTGAFNRRHMHVTLSAAIERRGRLCERASVLAIDVDRFKEVNDVLGHAEGDRVLKDLVALVGQRLRRLDALFRVGGEEFVLLLSGTRFVDALSVAEDLRGLVQDAGLIPGRHLSISVGVVELALGQTLPDWLAEADAALYRAKRDGRNRVAGRFGAPLHHVEDAGNRLPFPVRTG